MNICAQCGAKFVPKPHKVNRYCSNACRIASNRKCVGKIGIDPNKPVEWTHPQYAYKPSPSQRRGAGRAR